MNIVPVVMEIFDHGRGDGPTGVKIAERHAQDIRERYQVGYGGPRRPILGRPTGKKKRRIAVN